MSTADDPTAPAITEPVSNGPPFDDDKPEAFPDIPREEDEEHHNNQPNRLRRPSAQVPIDEEDIIPTAIVIKNIPFAMKRDQLIAIIDELKLPQPYALNYHFENGAFRGLAFANFRIPGEADLVVNGLEGYDVMGRKIKVEYKKVLPPEEAARKDAERKASILALEDRVTEFDLSDPATRQLYEKMVQFRDDKTRFELVFAKTISGPERKLVRAIGQRLGFFYRTEDNGEERFFKVARKSAPLALKDKVPRKYSMSAAPRPNLAGLTPTLGTGIPAGLAIADHRVPVAVANLRAAEANSVTGRMRAYSMGAHDLPAQRPAMRKNSMLSQAPPPGFNALRQPKGPDGVGGFGSTPGSRKGSLNPGAPPFSVTEVQAAVEAANQRKTDDVKESVETS
jgi:RNA recognition motif-containing protein